MALPIISIAALVLILTLAIYQYVILPVFLSPLAKIPNAHWSAPLSRLWILYHRSREEETPTVHLAHQRHGPIIRIAPNEVSVNSIDGGIRTIYAGGFEKGDWYKNVFNNYGIMPMFAMPEHAPHSKRKRMLSNIYAKSTLQNSPAIYAISKALLDDRLMPCLRDLNRKGNPIEFYDVFAAITMDFVTAYVFGLRNSSALIERPDMNRKFFRDYKARQRYQFWPQDLPLVTSILGKLGLKWLVVPEWVNQANSDIEAWILSMCDKAEGTLNQLDDCEVGNRAENYPTVYAQLRNALLKENSSSKGSDDSSVARAVRDCRLEVASEMLDHTLAGFDTSSITLTFYAWELSRSSNKHWQDRLRRELLSLPDKHDAKAVDALPILHATLMETLRLHAAIPGNQPRITPASATLGVPGPNNLHITDLPAGVRVQSQAWSLHRNPSVFPEPEKWNPGRWLEASYPSKTDYMAAQKEMSRWFWAFGSGGRMCVGSNLAMLDMKAIIASIWGTYRTEVVYDRGMVHRGGYVAEPIGKEGKYCMLKLEEN
ncbi:hypothetical protein M433DRAFT_61231 [Acidomyces richmondensis BFW]|nr:MAG: hypothetical protein FE78DRAFT_148570 [Acidomyces sp. 'richmondensis']KYG48379.1 hypothetical protein M433DRAFT_61231 [Acidomyces richmondensis BFW]